MPLLSIACAIHDRDLARRHLLPSVAALDGEPPVTFFLDNSGNALSANMAHLCNVLVRLDGPSARAIVHPDVSFPPDFAVRIGLAIAELEEAGAAWGALGAVGRSWEGEYVWGHEIDAPRAVCTLDACCVVVDTRHGIAFDELTFDGFHCHVEDYCLQCHADGRGVFVVPLGLEHASATFASHGSQWGDYPEYRRRLTRKWGARFPTLTTT